MHDVEKKCMAINSCTSTEVAMQRKFQAKTCTVPLDNYSGLYITGCTFVEH